MIEGLIEAGIEGLEAYHTHHSPSNTRRAIRFADENGLLVTGGTDSHGPKGSHPVEVGEIDIPDACAEALVAWAEEHDRPMPC